jgi:hypothetical protein
MPLDPETETLRQWLGALVKDADAAEAKVATARRHVQAARLLLEEEQTTAANLERKAAATDTVLTDHVLSDDAFTDDPTWTKMDVVVLCWLTNTITVDLQEIVRERGRPVRHIWLTLEN